MNEENEIKLNEDEKAPSPLDDIKSGYKQIQKIYDEHMTETAPKKSYEELINDKINAGQIDDIPSEYLISHGLKAAAIRTAERKEIKRKVQESHRNKDEDFQKSQLNAQAFQNLNGGNE